MVLAVVGLWRCGGEDGRAAAVVLAVGDRRSSKKWRRCMASVGGRLDRSGDGKYFCVRQKTFLAVAAAGRRFPFVGKRGDVRDDFNGGVGSATCRVKEAFMPKFSSWLRLRAGEW
nr:hypothetical protein [Tanacetum cinerariifolium]